MIAEFDKLPGADRVRGGLRDMANGQLTIDAYLVAIAASRLRELGVPVPPVFKLPRDPQLHLYQQLVHTQRPDPYYEYNASLRILDSFLDALEARQRRRGG